MIAFIGGITNLLTRYDKGIIPMKTSRVIELFLIFFIFLNKLLKKKSIP